jgi:hypothetical protein
MRQRYIQDPVTHQLIPAEEYYQRSEVNAPMVMGDIQPYQSMATGEMITSRSRHREHLKQHGLIEVGNETKYISQKKEIAPPTGLKERIAEIANAKLR